ncbi:MobQ family relaxase [Marinobacter sp.]|uniref:MobQ family relaxase n=1 Tax=Marinobacter sp. TaxID=50741 RepID=UPI003561B8FE
MAIYRFSSQIIKRSEGRSATAAAAYRAADKIYDRTTGEVFDYTRKRGVFESCILAPDFAPNWVYDRSELWNQVEEAERRGDAQLAREIELAIPVELSIKEGINLVKEFANDQFVDRGMIVDIAFHNLTSGNPHPHLLVSMREINENGFGKKNRAWNDRGLIATWREQWANYANRYLENACLDIRIDHRSYAEQGLDKIPKIHMGPAVAAMERQGIATRIGDINRHIEVVNAAQEREVAELETRWREVFLEIEVIRKESSYSQQTSGTLSIAPENPVISVHSAEEASKFEIGVASSIAEHYKARLFQKTWNVEAHPRLLKQLKWVDRHGRSLTLNSGEQIVDEGNKVNLSRGTDDGISAGIEVIKAKGWQRVTLNGSDDFQLRAALALKEEGILPVFSSASAEKSFLKRSEAVSVNDFQSFVVTRGEVSNPETRASSERQSQCKSQIARLKKYVREAIERNPLPSITVLQDNPEFLRRWARARWKELEWSGSPDLLAEAFRAVAEEQAYLAGYSVRSVQDVGIDDTLTALLAGSPAQRSTAPNAKAKSSSSDLSQITEPLIT